MPGSSENIYNRYDRTANNALAKHIGRLFLEAMYDQIDACM